MSLMSGGDPVVGWLRASPAQVQVSLVKQALWREECRSGNKTSGARFITH